MSIEKWRTNATRASFTCGWISISLALMGLVHCAIVQEHYDWGLAIGTFGSLAISLIGLILGAFGRGPQRRSALKMCGCIFVIIFCLML
jgi:hypothetical protein